MQFRIFGWLVGAICVINMLVMNDFASLWDGAEAALARGGAGGESPLHLPAMIQKLLWNAAGGNLFIYRLPGTIWLLGAAAGLYFLARPLFGQRTVILTLLVAGASLGIPQLAKVATADAGLLALHTIAFVLLLRYLKQPRTVWRIAFYGAVLLAGLIHPFSTLILFCAGPAVLYFRHPQGKRLWALQPWAAAIVAFGIAWLTGSVQWNPPWLLANFPSAPYWVVALLGFLPFTGFVLSGLRDYIPKLRKGDETALIIIAWLVAGLLAGSSVAGIALALLIARQMDAYFHPNYPFAAVVQTGAVLHLILIFFAAMGLMLGGLYYFEGVGFRAGLAVGAAYWSMSFLGVIGLYGRQRRLAIGGPILAGALAVLLFWLQAFPLLESRRKQEVGLLSETPADAGAGVDVLHAPINQIQQKHKY
jgi:hypothetical protein